MLSLLNNLKVVDTVQPARLFEQALRMLEDTETKLGNLRNMLTEGENSGFTNYSYKSFLSELDNEKH